MLGSDQVAAITAGRRKSCSGSTENGIQREVLMQAKFASMAGARTRGSGLRGRRQRRRPRPGRRKAHHRDLLAAVARRAAAAGHQGAEDRHRQRPRHHLRGAAAGCLCDAVQLRRVQGRRQRVAHHARPRRRARRQGDVPVQPVRLLGNDRHLARQREDAEGPRRQGAGRRALDHELPDVRVLREEAGRRRLQDQGRQHRAARPRSATPSPTAPTRCRSGSRPTR